MAATLTDIFRILKEIRDKESRIAISGRTSSATGSQPIISSLDAVLAELKSQSTTLSSLALQTAVDGVEGLITAGNVDLAAIEVLLAEDEGLNVNKQLTRIQNNVDGIEALLAIDETLTINENLTRIQNNVDGLESLITSTNTKLDSLIAKDFSTQTTLELMRSQLNANTNGIEGKLDAVNAELDSIDDNWNLLSVNNVALLVISVAAVLQATEAKQDTIITRLETTNNKLSQRYKDGTGRRLVIFLTSTTTQVLTADAVEQIQVIAILGEPTAARTVTVGIRYDDTTTIDITSFSVAAGTIVRWDDAKWDPVREVVNNHVFMSDAELSFTADAVTSSESITISGGLIQIAKDVT